MKQLVYIVLIIEVCISALSLRAEDISSTLIRRYITEYEALEKSNAENDRMGRSSQNQYIIEIDTINWIEVKLQPNSPSYNFTRIREALVNFNNTRTDDLRIYVVVINGFKGSLKENIKLDAVPESNQDMLKWIKYDANYTKFDNTQASVLKGVYKALYKGHHKNNIIYFCGLIDICSSVKNCIPRLADVISINGPKLNPKKDFIIKLTHANWVNDDRRTEPVEVRIEKAVLNIINAVRYIDAGIENDDQLKDPACTISLDGTVAQTKEKKLASFSAEALAMASMLEVGTSYRPLDSRYLLVDELKNFPDDIFFRYRLPDKLNMMAEGFSNFKMYVIFKEVSFAMMPSEWSAFAQEVYENSNFAKHTSNIILVTVPYYKGSCQFTNLYGQKLGKNGMLFFAAAYCRGNTSLASEMNAALTARVTLDATPENPFELSFNQAFKRIPKKYIVYNYQFMYDGSVISAGPPAEYASIVGFEDLVDIQLLIDQRFEAYGFLLQEVALLQALIISNQSNVPLNKQRRNTLQNKFREISAIETSPPIYKAAPGTNLIQSQLNSAIVSEYVLWYSHRKYYGKWGSLFGATDGEYFYGGENPVRNKDILDMIDMASLATAVVGLDVVFDGIGAYYASQHGMYEEVAIYTLAVAIPLVCSPALRKAIKEAKVYVTRTVKGTYIALPGRLAIGAGFSVEGMSSFLRRVLGDESFEMVAKYKREARFLESLEEAMVKDEKIIGQFNKIDGLSDEYHAFYSAGKGDVATFLEQRLFVGPPALDGTFQVTVNGVSVGGGNLFDDGLIRLTIDVFKGPKGSRLAFGDEVFEKIHAAIAKEAEKDGRSIKGIAGMWAEYDDDLRDNLDLLNKAILNEVKRGEMTLEQAALNKTFTGKMARDKGYTEVLVRGIPDPEDGTYKFVNAYFSNDPKVIEKLKEGL